MKSTHIRAMQLADDILRSGEWPTVTRVFEKCGGNKAIVCKALSEWTAKQIAILNARESDTGLTVNEELLSLTAKLNEKTELYEKLLSTLASIQKDNNAHLDQFESFLLKKNDEIRQWDQAQLREARDLNLKLQSEIKSARNRAEYFASLLRKHGIADPVYGERTS